MALREAVRVLLKINMLEDVAIIAGLIVVQFMYAGNSVVLGYLMLSGFTSASLIILSSFATFVVLAPFSIYFERNRWPTTFGLKLWIQFLLISFGGVTLFQSLLLKGIRLTSPAMATAMPNLVPGLIFFTAWALRLEKVKLSCIYSKAKIAGTVLCVIGALTMSLLQSTADIPTEEDAYLSEVLSPPAGDKIFDAEKIIGCLYLLAAVMVLSSSIILQATTLNEFPAPISLCAITSLIGVVMTVIVQYLQGGSLRSGWRLLSLQKLIAYIILAGLVGGGSTSFQTWAIKKRGPVLVSMFSPVATVISIILSGTTLGETISLGSLAGMFLMFTGLYFVLWAKGKEKYSVSDEVLFDRGYDPEEPLLA